MTDNRIENSAESEFNEYIDKVLESRRRFYGHPKKEFERTSKLLSAAGFRFLTPSGELREICSTDIPVMMILVKLSREINAHKDDNLVDVIGYVKCLQEFY